MERSETNLIAWIAARFPAAGRDILIGLGDDMAMVRAPADGLLVASDMLMDGVHFDTSVHTPGQIGRKALAVNLSDCAAMAARPAYAVVSVALPESWTMRQAQGLYEGMEALAAEHQCAILGGDTNSWPNPLVLDVAVIAEPWQEIRPVRRDGMMAGDAMCVTGRLGGSRLGHHLSFVPRVQEARELASRLGPALHAMIDLSDGLSTDSHRLATASGPGIEYELAALEGVLSEDAGRAANQDGQDPMEHLLHDGEDFELLFAIDPEAMDRVVLPCAWARVGTAVEEPGVWLRRSSTERIAIDPRGWEHWTGA